MHLIASAEYAYCEKYDLYLAINTGVMTLNTF